MRVTPLLFLAPVVIGCSSEAPTAVAPAISSFTVAATALDLARGGAVTTVATVERSESFRGDVKLSAENVPAGMNVVFTPAALDNTERFSEVRVTAISSLAAGDYSFVVRATGIGVEARAVNMSVNVTIPDLALAVSQASVTMEQGTTHEIPISITRSGGFTGIVGLNVLGLPLGTSASFTKAVLQPGETESVVTINAPLIVTPTTKPITIRASGGGVPDRTFELPLTIAPTTTPSIYLTMSNPVMAVQRGAAGFATVNVLRFGGFTDAVTLELLDLPTGMEGLPIPVAADANSALVRIDALPQSTDGAYAARIRGSAPGTQPFEIPITLQISTQSSFFFRFVGVGQSVAESQSPVLTVSRGSTLPLTLEITRLGGLNTPFTLSWLNLPPQLTHTLPASLPGGSTDHQVPITLTIPADFPLGESSFNLRIATTGRSVSTSVTLLVN